MKNLIHGKTPASKFASIEKVLQSFQRRLSTKVIGMMPPVIVAHEQRPVASDGVLFRGINPIFGRLSYVCVYLDLVLSDVLQIELQLSDDKGDHSYTNATTGSTQTFGFDKAVAPGDIVVIRTRPGIAMSYALTSLLITPNPVTNMQPTPFMVEQFLALEEQENASESAEE